MTYACSADELQRAKWKDVALAVLITGVRADEAVKNVG